MKIAATLVIVSVLVLSVTGVDLRGKWKEDQYKRKGLNDFLLAVGKNKYNITLM